MSFLSENWSTLANGANATASTANTWVKNIGSGANANFLADAAGGATYNDGTGGGTAQYTCTDKLPATADYTFEGDVIVDTVTGNSTGFMIRCTGSGNAASGYGIYYRPFHGCFIARVDSLALTIIGTSNTGTTDPANGSTIHLKLQGSGATLTATVTGGMSGSWSTTDSTYAAKGTVGIMSTGGVTNATGPHLDNLVATDTIVPGVEYVGSPLIDSSTLIGMAL